MFFQTGIYWIIDPLCGWSYGALPLINRIAQRFPQAQYLLPGGLFIGAQRRRIDASWLQHVHEHDDRIAKLTGMPFGDAYRHSLLATEDLLLDSLPASQGLLAVQRFAQAGAETDYLNAVQSAWYRDGRDITRASVVDEIIRQSCGQAISLTQVRADETIAAIQHGRMLMAQVRGQGFPTAVLADRQGVTTLLPAGQFYGQPEQFFATVTPHLEQTEH
ncbi:DsbA family protein [Erwinia sp. V71]|uniref:DsbA family protein n=1 Tax=Erwinia sp. V71 TaxID=3369424 RepID=UPI003F646CCB